ncbi:MAG: hypothetical protein VKK59_06210 [Vampirovibrionales bacterium]|nr:hypothetical protein [Vampirovibrionales bacterium]
MALLPPATSALALRPSLVQRLGALFKRGLAVHLAANTLLYSFAGRAAVDSAGLNNTLSSGHNSDLIQRTFFNPAQKQGIFLFRVAPAIGQQFGGTRTARILGYVAQDTRHFVFPWLSEQAAKMPHRMVCAQEYIAQRSRKDLQTTRHTWGQLKEIARDIVCGFRRDATLSVTGGIREAQKSVYGS